MSFETMTFILGALLLGAGLFGGGLEIKELKLPTIGGGARYTCAALGAAFLVLALSMDLRWIGPAQAQEKHEAAATSVQTFDAPMLDGMRLDVCVVWAARCGEEAASAWCQTQGFSRATVYTTENVGSQGVVTRLVGSRQVCAGTFCSGFARVTCVK